MNDELVDAPVLEAAVGQVPPHDDGDLALLQLLHRDLQRVRLALQLDHDRGAHGDLQRPRPQHPRPLVLLMDEANLSFVNLKTDWMESHLGHVRSGHSLRAPGALARSVPAGAAFSSGDQLHVFTVAFAVS